MPARPLLILDLDETLIFATKRPSANCDFRVGAYFVTNRPHLEEFLSRAAQMFDVAVWTSASEPHATDVVSTIFPDPTVLAFAWDGNRCTIRRDPATDTFYNIKDLKKVKRNGYRLQQVLMIDDTPRKLCRNYGNHLPVEPFEGDMADRELRNVVPYLEWISGQPDFRTIDKRFWKRRLERRDDAS